MDRDEQFDVLVPAVYKVLLILGMVGAIRYSTDRVARAAVRSLSGAS